MRTHSVGAAEFRELAAGYGTAAGIATLLAAQVSRRLLMLRSIVDTVGAPRLGEALGLLSEAQERAPRAFFETIAAPAFGTWAVLALRDRNGVIAEQLGTFAVSAAIRAGLDYSIDLPAVDGGVYVPGLGRATVTEPWVTARGKAGGHRIGDVALPGDLSAETADWQALRRLTATADGQRREVLLDDLDPWRGNHGLSAAGRCDAEVVARWQELVDEAWEVLVRHHARYAEAIGTGLRTIVPLNVPSSGNSVNATSLWAFGSVSLTLPAGALGLASSLLHEFQHAKLGALLDLVPMYEDDGERRFYAPWRDDPRPLGGVLQGVYAFLGVTDFWRVQRDTLEGRAADFAAFEFVRWRDQVRQVLETLEREDAFTPAGRAFVAGLRQTLNAWLGIAAPADLLELAAETAEDHRVGWRLRNVLVEPDDAAQLASAWLAGGAAHWPVRSRIVARDVVARARNARLDLAVLRLSDPDGFEGTCARPAEDAFVRGDYAVAAAEYRERIAADPDDQAGWSGLAMACRHTQPQTRLWAATPELPFAVHRAVRAAGGAPPDPLAVARWLAAAADQVGGGSTTQ
jgi:HEXXH motif-containing protein